MKKVLTILAMAALVLSCGNNGGSKSGAKGGSDGEKAKEETKAAGAAKSKISIGDKFAFAGLQSDKLVPEFAVELSELSVDPRSESKPMKDEAFFYTGVDITKIPADKVQAYLQGVYSAVKAAADDGKVFKAKGLSGDELGEEITAAPTTDKPAATVMYLYRHDGVWFNVSVGHKAYFRKFKKDYGEKWIGAGVTVKEMLGEVK